MYVWDSLLETGYTTIDEQHKKLIEALNRLLDACMAGTGKNELERTIDFLLAYTVKHFQDEEALQTQYEYPDIFRHKQIHEEFKTVAISLAERLRKEGPSTELVAEVYSHMGDWLVNHIKGDDFRMAAFIKWKAAQ